METLDAGAGAGAGRIANDGEKGMDGHVDERGMKKSQAGPLDIQVGERIDEIGEKSVGKSEIRQIEPDEVEVEMGIVNVEQHPVDLEESFPEGGWRAWSVVAAAFLTLYPSFGFIVAMGTLQDHWLRHQLSSMSARDIGWISSVFAYITLAGGIAFGPIIDKYGPRWIMVGGSIAFAAMTFLLAECATFCELMLCVGILGGVAGASLTTTSLACVAHWFKRRRALAQGIAMMGSSFGGLTIPLILRSTLPGQGYRWAIRILAFIFTGCLLIGNLLMEARIPPTPSVKRKPILQPSMFRDLRFSLLSLTIFGLEFVIFAVLGILPTYATLTTAFAADTGFYLIAMLNGLSCLGRLLPGYIADKIGRLNTLLMSIVLTLVCMFGIWLPLGTTSLRALYAFAAIFGFGTGCWMALVPACIGQLCRAEDFGRFYGTSYFVASLSTLVCIPISGELVQNLGASPLALMLSVVCAGTLVLCLLTRWACLDRSWKWNAKL